MRKMENKRRIKYTHTNTNTNIKSNKTKIKIFFEVKATKNCWTIQTMKMVWTNDSNEVNLQHYYT